MVKKSLAKAIEREFADAGLGDARRDARLVAMAVTMAKRPGLSFPKAMGDDAALEGTYRFLNNPRVKPDKMLAPHQRCTVQRIALAGPRIVIAHDTTPVAFGGTDVREGLGHMTSGGQGFFAHCSLAIVPDEARTPLGVLGLSTWIRQSSAARKGAKRGRPAKKPTKTKHVETACWHEQAERCEELMPPGVEAVHVMDRYADTFEVLSALTDRSSSFVVRAKNDRFLVGEDDSELGPRLSEALMLLKGRCRREVPLSRRVGSRFPANRRTHPARLGRIALLEFAATTITFGRPKGGSATALDELTLNVVQVRELDAPEGEMPVSWTLLTSLEVDTAEQILEVVDCYRARWTIEEFFKALKSGCALEKRQLESYDALCRALALFTPIAWRLLLMRSLARSHPSAPAILVLTPTQLQVLRAISRKALPAKPTAQDVLLAVAALGGHIKNNGPPGWAVLARGLEDLLMAEIGWLARSDQS